MMRSPVETKVAAGGGAGALVSLLFGLAGQYHWFAPPSPYLTALAVTVLSFAAGWLAPHTPLMLAAEVAPPGPAVINVKGGLTQEQAQAIGAALGREARLNPVASSRKPATQPAEPMPDARSTP